MTSIFRIFHKSRILHCLSLCGLAISQISNASADDFPNSASLKPNPALVSYAKPQRLVTLADGRVLHMRCEGRGTPTVILTAGLGDWSAAWSAVQPALSRKTRVCGWDRAGFGFSGPSSDSQDADHTTVDLEQALAAGEIAGPYVLIGTSAGSYETLLFTDRHRQDVAGIVLVDPSIPDQLGVIGSVSPKAAALIKYGLGKDAASARRCAADLQSGLLRDGGADPDKCFAYPPQYPEDLKVALARLDSNPARQLTKASLSEQFGRASLEVADKGRNYEDLPLVVLTAGKQEIPPALPADVASLFPVWFQKWQDAHDALAALSTQGHNQIVEGAGHSIETEKPEAVIAAAGQIIDQARAMIAARSSIR